MLENRVERLALACRPPVSPLDASLACGQERLVAFSRKGRGFCPSGGGRRMADTAAHLVDRGIPEVPVRQWVLSLPFALRYRLAYDAGLASAVLAVFVRAVFASLRRRARRHWGLSRSQCGAVTFVQRFGDALNLNLHFHSLVLDGVHAHDRDGRIRFHPLPPPNHAEVARVARRAARGIARRLEQMGIGAGADPSDADPLAAEQPLLANLYAASVQGRVATGPRAGQRLRRIGDRIDVEALPALEGERCASVAGMSLHASVAVPARDRQRLERLCRYVARPPVATERLSRLPDGRLLYRLKHRRRDGTRHVVFDAMELVEKLAALVPPPRFHLVRYHGIFGPCASARDAVVPVAKPSGHEPGSRRCSCSRSGSPCSSRRRGLLPQPRPDCPASGASPSAGGAACVPRAHGTGDAFWMVPRGPRCGPCGERSMRRAHRRFGCVHSTPALDGRGPRDVPRVALILAALASFLLVPRAAQAIDVLDVDRSVSILACIFDPIFSWQCTTSSDADPVGDGHWASAVSDLGWAASQDSLVAATELSGTGSVTKDNTYPQGGYAATQYHVIFAVTAATPYAFDVQNLEAAGCYPWSPAGFVTLKRVDPSDPSVVLEVLHSVSLSRSTIPPECGTLPGLSVDGALAAGTYALDYVLGVSASHNAGAPGTASFSLVLTEPALTLTPEVSLNAPGGSHTVAAQMLDGAGQPKPGASVAFTVVAGPNEGASGVCTFDPGCATGSDGFVYFTYQSGGAAGVDRIVATSEALESDTVRKFWDADCNENEVPDTCDLSCEGFDGECAAFATCGSSLDTNGDLKPDECNAPPDCALADVEPNELSPPNRSFTPVSVQGVNDEDGDVVTVSITSIHQDEPIAGGNARPDGHGVGGDTALLRAEREGGGDGRVYHVGFSASDGRGGVCTGAVTVCVPRDMRPGHACVDQGALYDSTVDPGGRRVSRRVR